MSHPGVAQLVHDFRNDLPRVVSREKLARNVRFTPKSGHWNSAGQCPLCAKSGLMHRTNFEKNCPLVPVVLLSKSD